MILHFRNLEEQKFVHNHVTNQKTTWIGANDRTTEGSWVWDSDKSSMSAIWASGEPNSGGGEEDCGNIGHFAEKLNDYNCESKQQVACQITK